MRLLIKQRVFSWTDTYDVYDENGTPKYFVKGEFLSIGHKIHIYRHDTGEEVGMVREKLMTVMPRFELIVEGRTLGSIQKRFSLFKPKYEIDYNDWRVEGDFLEWDYDVRQECCPIMHIRKEPFHWGDTYVIDYACRDDELIGLLTVIAIDAANCSDGN